MKKRDKKNRNDPEPRLFFPTHKKKQHKIVKRNKEEVYIKEGTTIVVVVSESLRVSVHFFFFSCGCCLPRAFFLLLEKRLDKPVFCFVTHYLCYCYFIIVDIYLFLASLNVFVILFYFFSLLFLLEIISAQLLLGRSISLPLINTAKESKRMKNILNCAITFALSSSLM